VPVFVINPKPKEFTSYITAMCSTALGKGMREGPGSKIQPRYK